MGKTIIKAPHVSVEYTTLYDGDKVTSGTITLSDYISNYDMIYFRLKTNGEYMTEMIPVSGLLTGTVIFMYAAYDSGAGSLFSRVQLTGTTNDKGFAVNVQGNSVNWVAGVIKIVGAKYKYS